MELKISPTSMNMFFEECEYKWKLTYIDQKTPIQIKDKERLFGNMLHNIIYGYYLNVPENPTDEEIEETIKKAMKDFFDPMFERRRNRVEKLMENFKKFEIQRVRRHTRTRPQLLESRLEAAPFSGIIDFYNEGELIDWKTSGVSNIASHQFMRQGKIYEWILTRNGYPVKSIYFFSLELGEFILCPRMSDEWLLRQYNQIVEKVKSGNFEKNLDNCEGCEQILNCKFSEVSLWREWNWE
jgi:hypothetical protein